jgi:hypothetical protein
LLPLKGRGTLDKSRAIAKTEPSLEELRKAAFESVSRGCAFAFLAIACVMMGVIYEPRLVFQVGGILTLLMTFVLMLKSRQALTRDYKRTEMWLLLPKDFRPPERYAQWAAATVLRDAYLTFAQYTALISIIMWAIAIFMRVTGTAAK